jgi:hypothetical protein
MSSIILRIDSEGSQPLAADLAACFQQFDEINAGVGELLTGLSENQFHWSPAPTRWSIAQCLAHLVIIACRYLPILDETMERARSQSLVGSEPFRYGLLERSIIRSTEPPVHIRLRTPSSARPPDDQPLPTVMANFLTMQDQLRERIRAANGLHLTRAKVTSPFAKRLKMGLGACFHFLLAHERRHLWQARQVRQHERFPAA